jgi:hypothetical protein
VLCIRCALCKSVGHGRNARPLEEVNYSMRYLVGTGLVGEPYPRAKSPREVGHAALRYLGGKLVICPTGTLGFFCLDDLYLLD